MFTMRQCPSDMNVHEPPPGFSPPAPPKPPKPLAPGEPLPLVAPAVAELQSSEPILTHLAGTIDSLASSLTANPTAANKVHDVLDVTNDDLSGLVQRFERLREEEKAKLDRTWDDQTRSIPRVTRTGSSGAGQAREPGV